ncbi:MAG: hypothetical protein EBT51_10225 [Flavobacteriaceae bacterium]|nr:hypothetical protein [Flavobacteriaceae bacterium]
MSLGLGLGLFLGQVKILVDIYRIKAYYYSILIDTEIPNAKTVQKDYPRIVQTVQFLLGFYYHG